MSDGFPLVACADAILSRGEVVEVVGRFPVSVLAFCRGRTSLESRTRSTLEPRVLWRAMRVAQLIVAPRPDEGRLGCSRWR
jgi:hypothetical protein